MSKLAMQRATIGAVVGVAATVVVLMALVSGLLVTNQTIPNGGSVKTIGVGVYWDSSCVNPVSSISWGTLTPNSSKSTTVYVKNNGTAAEVLSMTTTNWSSSAASSHITLSWDRVNHTLSHGASVSANLTLTVSPDITSEVTSFSFDIIMTGTENA